MFLSKFDGWKSGGPAVIVEESRRNKSEIEYYK